MSNLETIIGIEIHIELNTKTKMFSAAANNFESKPNTNVWPVDIGYPGALPVVNKEAIKKGIQFSKALNMKVNEILYFDRKNYYYFDLPKGYQITQDEKPIGKNGTLFLLDGKKINIERVQLEEDTAKSIHKNGMTYLNYNRSGVPLIEVVSYPEISNAKEASEYVKTIRDIALALDISDAKMEEGSLRADINISLRPYGQTEFGTKVEIKNLNSISNIEKAIAIEIKKQTSKILKCEEVLQETKRFDENTQDTITMRVKTGAVDYKFFPEPNIPPIFLGKEFIDSIEINELPWERKERYVNQNIPNEYIEKLMANLSQANYFDSISYKEKEKLAKIFFAEIVSLANSKNKNIKELNIDINEISIMLVKLENGEISGKHVKTIIPELINKKNTVDKVIKLKRMALISDEKILLGMIQKIIDSNKEFIYQNIDRHERVNKFILGTLMKETRGQANPVISNKILKNIIK